jgi:hypothetical protein
MMKWKISAKEIEETKEFFANIGLSPAIAGPGDRRNCKRQRPLGGFYDEI